MEISNFEIYKYLDLQGIKHSYRGYTYLFVLIKLLAERPNRNLKLCDIYALIGKKFNVKPANVEKSIRYSILHKQVTNKEFIAKALNELVISRSSPVSPSYIWWKRV